jgi:hypothetical protein
VTGRFPVYNPCGSYSSRSVKIKANTRLYGKHLPDESLEAPPVREYKSGKKKERNPFKKTIIDYLYFVYLKGVDIKFIKI